MKKILNTLNQHASEMPGKIALRGSDTVLSYAALNEQIEQLASVIIAKGWRTLAIMLDNCPAWVVIDLAAARADVTLLPLPGFFTDQQLEHSLADADVEALITDQPERFGNLDHHALDNKNIAGTELHCLLFDDPMIKLLNATIDDTIKITYTSGTTGTPKGVCLSGTAIDTVTTSLVHQSQIQPNDVHLCLLPLATLFENISGIYVPLLAGATIALPSLHEVGMQGASGVDINCLIFALEQHGATRAILLPQLLQALVERLEAGESAPQQLRFLAVGGATVSQRLLYRAAALGLPVFQGYGLSECCSVVALNNNEHNRPGSVGRPLPHVSLRFNKDGEIFVKGALFNGYLGEILHSGSQWWPTGDIGYVDSDGYLFITARKKNVFITSFGRNVAPEWVEQELTLTPAIAQAFIHGEARPWNVAVLVTTATDNEIQRAVDETNIRLPDYARIGHWLRADAPFSVANSLLTATDRLRRLKIWQTYGERIDAHYSASDYRKEKL